MRLQLAVCLAAILGICVTGTSQATTGPDSVDPMKLVLELGRSEEALTEADLYELKGLYGQIQGEEIRVPLTEITDRFLRNDVRLVSRSAESLVVESTGRDPILILARLPDIEADYLLKLDLEVSKDSTLQLFHKNQGEKFFNEEKSLSCPVKMGRSELVLPIVSNDPIRIVRLDPIMGTGGFEIRSVVFKVIDRGTAKSAHAPNKQVDRTGPGLRELIGLLGLFLTLTLIGMGAALQSRHVLGITNITLLLAFSWSMGCTVAALSLLVVGQLGYSVCGWSMVMVLGFLVSASVTLSFMTVRNDSATRAWIRTLFDFNATGLYCYACFFTLFASFVWVNQIQFFPNWDHFTFWLTDAKLIYLSGHLRLDYDVISMFNYSSYYPLHGVMMYEFLGAVREQYASLFTIGYGFCGTVIAFSALNGKQPLTRYLAAGCLIVMNLVMANTQALIWTFYAEAIFAFLVAFYVLLLIRDTETDLDPMKYGLLAVTLIAMSLVKPTNRYYIYVLIAGTLILERSQLLKIRFRVPWIKVALLISSIVALVFGSRYYYLHVLFDQYRSKRMNTLPAELAGLEKYGVYVQNLISYLSAHLYVPIAMIIAIWVVVFMRRQVPRKAWVIGLMLLALPMLNFFHWTITLTSTASNSLLRYATTVYYGIPMYLTFARPRLRFDMRTVIAACLPAAMTIVGVVLTQWQAPNDPLHNGSYLEARWQRPYVSRARRIKPVIKDQSLMICSALEVGDLTNQDYMGICLSYHLVENVVGGTFLVNPDRFERLLRKVQPSYLYFPQPNRFTEQHLELGENQDALVRVSYGDELKYDLVFSD